jgi:uncharacterized protein YjiS (DUF1127 family)
MATLRSAAVIEDDTSSPSPDRWLGRLADWWRRHRGLDELRHLTNAQLRDIGIERRDLEALIEYDLSRFRFRCW